MWIMTIERVRDLLWDIASPMSDEELQAFIIQCKRIASIILDFAEEEARK